jgi:hypothetical protein
MFALFWPFDWSCSGFFFVLFLILGWLLWSIGETAKSAAEAAKKLAQDETAQEVGKGILQAWVESFLNKR